MAWSQGYEPTTRASKIAFSDDDGSHSAPTAGALPTVAQGGRTASSWTAQKVPYDVRNLTSA